MRWVTFCVVASVAVALDAGLLEAFRSGDADGDARLDAAEFQAALASLYVAQAKAGTPTAPAAASQYLQAAKNAPAGDAGFYRAFVNSLGMIWATEVGDKTFFIAAIMAMRHARHLVFAGALGALAVMTVLSALLGLALPSLLPRTYTHYASAGLFLYFGLRLLRDAQRMEGGAVSEELEEVEEELGVGASKKQDGVDAAEAGATAPRPPDGKAAALRVLSQAFALTFLAEWGDRSQIATIALAAAKDPYGVVAGGILGHAMCTGLAVVGGRMLAARISEKHVAVCGGLIFLGFAIYSFLVEDPQP
jgi:putative Ca2+/H+ antiporter (TMEM165/GDT1 family)